MEIMKSVETWLLLFKKRNEKQVFKLVIGKQSQSLKDLAVAWLI